MINKKIKNIPEADISRIVEMAWEDRTPFETIYLQYGLTNGEVIKLMRKNMKRSSFLMWRRRTQEEKQNINLCFPEKNIGLFQIIEENLVENNFNYFL